MQQPQVKQHWRLDEDDVEAQYSGSSRHGDYRAFYINRQGNHYDVYLSQDIVEPSRYCALIDLIRRLEEHQSVHIHINCLGGRIDTTVQIIHAIQETDGQVVAVVDGQCASAATMIMLACHGWKVNPFARAMIHGWSGGVLGKVQETRAEFQFEDAWLETMYRAVYSGFLSEQEIASTLDGKDLYFDADEIAERLRVYAEYQQNQYTQATLEGIPPKPAQKKTTSKKKPRKA